MQTLVTGRAGFIGSHLVDALLAAGHQVTVLDDYSTGKRENLAHLKETSGFSVIRGSILDMDAVQSSLDGVDQVFHLAAAVGVDLIVGSPVRCIVTNAMGTHNVLEACANQGVGVLLTSTSEVYGDYSEIMSEEVMDEIEIKQLNDYALSKWVNEIQIRNSRLQHNTRSVIVRLFNTYGPGEYYHPYRSIHCKLCYHALMGIPVVIYRGHHRSSIYIEDCCQTLVRIIDRFQPGEVYNIGGSNEWKNIDIVRLICKLMDAINTNNIPHETLISFVTDRLGHDWRYAINMMKLQDEFKWQPKISFETRIEKTVEWYI